MEPLLERPLLPKNNTDISAVKWPDVPQSSLGLGGISNERETPETQKTITDVEISPTRETVHSKSSTIVPNRVPHPPAIQSPRDVTVELPSQAPPRRWLQAKLGRFGLPKTQWPDPHLSIGIKCNRMGGNECWEASGPAKGLFSQISESIGDLLETRIDELEEGEPVAGNILMFGMYMVGKSTETARPTLIFSCQRPKPRRRAIKFVKESAILKGLPKIALAESSMNPVVLAGNGLILPASTKSLTKSYSCFDAQGIPIICKSTGKRATIGGIVFINDVPYGLTVGHCFARSTGLKPIADVESNLEALDNDPEFAFDDAEDEEQDEIDPSDLAATSRASMSSMASLSRPATIATVSSEFSTADLCLSTETENEAPQTVILNLQRKTTPSMKPLDQIKLGRLYASSASGTRLGLDWALVEVFESGFQTDDVATLMTSLSNNIIHPQTVVSKVKNEAAVVTMKGYSGKSCGTISSSLTMMKLPQSNSFQEVWVVRLEDPLVEGDSGSWVVDAANGELYGHIVAGFPGKGIAYIVPAYKIFEDITNKFGAVELESKKPLAPFHQGRPDSGLATNTLEDAQEQFPQLDAYIPSHSGVKVTNTQSNHLGIRENRLHSLCSFQRTSNYLDDLWSLRENINSKAPDLFKEKIGKAPMKLKRRLMTNSEDWEEQKGIWLEDVDVLDTRDVVALRNNNDLTQIFTINQDRAWTTLNIRQDIFEGFMESYNIMPTFWKYMFTFGRKIRENKFQIPGFGRRKKYGNEDRLTTELAYMLHRAERNGRQGPDGEETWSIRQTATYHQITSKASMTSNPSSRSMVLIIAPSENAELHFSNCIQNGTGVVPTLLSTWNVHRILVADSLRGWMEYMEVLEKKLEDCSDKIVLANVRNDKDHTSPLADLDINFEDLQKLQIVESDIISLQLLLPAMLETIKNVDEEACQFRSTTSIGEGYCEKQILNEFREYARETDLLIHKARILKKQSQSTSQLLYDALSYKEALALKALENQSMFNLAEKSTKDVASIKVLTVITLIYLPTTIVANFFSTQFVKESESGHVTIASNVWILAAISIPLTMITIFLWWAWVHSTKVSPSVETPLRVTTTVQRQRKLPSFIPSRHFISSRPRRRKVDLEMKADSLKPESTWL